MTINLEKWAKDVEETIKAVEDVSFFSGLQLWQNDAYKLMTDLKENETIIQGSKYQSLFGSLRHVYQEATGKIAYKEIKA